MTAVVWPEAADRDQWWRGVLGIETGVQEVATQDSIDQNLAEPLDEESYPWTSARATAQ